MNKIAFHLGRGANYMHYQLKLATGEIVYVNPELNDVILKGCKLRNQQAASMKIFKGANKERCAWIDFDSYEVIAKGSYTSETHIRFNPRVSPTWTINGEGGKDNTTFDVLKTNGNQIYA